MSGFCMSVCVSHVFLVIIVPREEIQFPGTGDTLACELQCVFCGWNWLFGKSSKIFYPLNYPCSHQHSTMLNKSFLNP